MSQCWCQGNCPHLAKFRKLERPAQEIAVSRALLRAPDCPHANRLMGLFLTQSNYAAFGTAHFERAFRFDDSELLHIQAGWNLRARGELDRAEAMFRKGLSLYPESAGLYEGLLTVLELMGDPDKAARDLEAAQKLARRGEPFRRLAAAIAHGQGDNERAIALLAGATDPLELSDRGRYQDQTGHYGEAWRDWMTAKQIWRNRDRHTYNAAHVESLVDGLQRLALRARELEATLTTQGPRPIFIGGFPRSGTTMLETVLSAHPKIAAGDELPFLNEIFERLPQWLNVLEPYPLAANGFAFAGNAGAQEAARSHYLRRSYAKIGIDPGLTSFQFFTDKMPLHEMHLGLISILFPDSIFYYLRRHPLDIIVSSLSHFLIHGHYYASSLESAAHYYAALDTLHQFYKRHLPQYRVHEVRYERFVADNVSETRALFPPPLEPVPACFNFHENPRHSRTISHNQVKKPVYRSSVDRHKPYLPMLAPILPRLAHILERENYTA